MRKKKVVLVLASLLIIASICTKAANCYWDTFWTECWAYGDDIRCDGMSDDCEPLIIVKPN